MSQTREKIYSTAELMKAFDLGRNTLRLYEEMGLLVGMSRTEAGYREFRAQHLEDLNFILSAKKTGFTLVEIKDLLEITRRQKQITCGTVSSEITNKVSDLEEQLRVIESKKVFLREFLKTCASNDDSTPCDIVSAGFTKSACCN